MAGKKGRSGRRSGSTSWWRNPTALAGHHLNVLIEMWLGGVPIQVAPKRWLVQPTEQRHTVPPKIKRALAAMAVGHVLALYPNLRRPSVDAVIAWTRRRAPSLTLRHAVRSTSPDEREVAYQEYLDYLDHLTTAWKPSDVVRKISYRDYFKRLEHLMTAWKK
jgi:hypothetical protein